MENKIENASYFYISYGLEKLNFGSFVFYVWVVPTAAKYPLPPNVADFE